MKRAVLAVLFLLAVGNAMVWREIFASRALRVDIFDVGQGDAVLIRSRLGHRILIDGGPGDTVLEKLGSVLPPWERSLDAVILTHPDADHMNGILAVLSRYEAGLLVWNGYEKDSKIAERWARTVQEAMRSGTAVREVRAGARIDWKGRGYLRILHPEEEDMSGSSNNASLVARMEGFSSAVLFPGDIERKSEYALLGRGENVEAEILLLPHHGSSSSSSDRFLYAVNPRVAVVSSGAGNRYGHPHETTLARLKRYGITVMRTDQNGNIRISLFPDARTTITSNGF